MYKFILLIKKSKYIKSILFFLAVFFFIGMVLVIKSLLPDSVPEQKKRVQKITMIRPPPPPPPTEIKEPEVEEEIIEEELEEALPDEGSDESVGEDLGVDAEGEAGADGFGLVGKKGGRGLLGGSYGGSIKAFINQQLLKDEKLKFLGYEAIITLWIDSAGQFEKYQVDLIEGNEDAICELERFFQQLGGVGKQKPLEEKNNRFKLRISSKL